MMRILSMVVFGAVVSMLLVSCKFTVNRAPEGAPCTGNVDCAGNKVCDKSAGVCVGCLVDTHCEEGLVCDPVESECVDCTKDGDCEGGFCLVDAQECVECLEETDCPIGFCDAEDHVCRECSSDADCFNENPCVESACASGLCLHVPGPDDKDCDDGDACTDGDYCQDGECVAGEIVPGCEGQCVGKSNGADCDDGDPCTQFEQCVDGECKGQEVPGCNAVDNDKDGFDAPPDGGDCNDDDKEVYPNAPELCDEKDNNCNEITDEGCDLCKDKECGDGDPCTEDTCNEETGDCEYVEKPNCTPCKEAAECDDDDICTLDDCIAEVCQYELIDSCGADCQDEKGCDDGDACTVDLCVNGFCHYEVGEECCPTGPETCDGKDNDCLGGVDDLEPEPCTAENEFGVCQGLSICISGEMVCDAPAPAPDVCDGLDNDCDEVPDDNLGETSCGEGLCSHTVPNCFDGKEQTCHPFDGASEEVCDGKDNDCDGQVDEELGIVSCGLGPCQHEEAACQNGVPAVCDPFLWAEGEECNGIDDDCDGMIDNTEDGCACTVGESTPCGLSTGECHKGTKYCDDGQWTECGGELFQPPEDEICDAKDNDCDGWVDEELGTQSCGLGVCSHTEDICKNGNFVPCNPMEGASSETCNNQDDDCDGVIDDGLGDYECGQGVCLQILPNCKNGAVPACNPFAGAGSEICNNKDDDCDGQVDNIPLTECVIENDWGECFGWKMCKEGEEFCDAQEPMDEICGNDLDDNCDGAVDEGCSECVVTGTCGELCLVHPQDSECNPNDPALSCLGKTSCGVNDATGACEWQQNDDYLACLQEVCQSQSEICNNNKDDNCNGQADEGCDAECETDCDCYYADKVFPNPCLLFCPNCDNFWKCENNQCIDYCDTIPVEVQACLEDCGPPYNYPFIELAQLLSGDYYGQNISTEGEAVMQGETCVQNPGCEEGNECCQTCTGQLYLQGNDVSGNSQKLHLQDGGVDVGCEWNGCDNVACTPFQPGGQIKVWGKMNYDQPFKSMVLEGFCF